MKQGSADKEKMLKQIQMLKQKYLKKSPVQEKTNKTEQSLKEKKQSNNLLIDNLQVKNFEHQSKKNQKKESELVQFTKKELIIQQKRQDPLIKEKTQHNEQKNTNKILSAAPNEQSKPVSSIIKEIISAPAPIQTINNKISKREFYEETDLQFFRDPFRIWAIPSPESTELDPQFTAEVEQFGDHIRKSSENYSQSQNEGEVQIQQICKKWVISPKKALSYIFFDDLLNLNIQSSPESSLEPLPLQSSNPNIPNLMKQVLTHFVFQPKKQLTFPQKEIIYNIAIEYFAPSYKKLSDILIICLVKLGKQYLEIYSQEIFNNISHYFKILFKYRDYFLKEQYEEFVETISGYFSKVLKANYDKQESYVLKALWLLLAKPQSSFLHQYFLPKKLSQLQLLAIFCTVQPEDNGTSLSLLYLKCLEALSQTFSEHGILQKVIENLNRIKVPQPLYKPTKSLKLKLIREADSQNKNKSVSKSNQQEKGFMSFLNEKMSKIKEKAQKEFSSKEQEDNKIELIFDKNSRKYIEK